MITIKASKIQEMREIGGKHREGNQRGFPRAGRSTVPSQDGHGLAVILAVQQFVHVGVQHSQGQLEYHFDSFIEETVHNHHCALEGHHTEEECEEPRQGDGGDHAQVLHAVIQLRHVVSGQLLEDTLVDQCAWGVTPKGTG